MQWQIMKTENCNASEQIYQQKEHLTVTQMDLIPRAANINVYLSSIIPLRVAFLFCVSNCLKLQ